MSTTIVTRATKGGRLSFTDMDNNLLNLKATADAAALASTTYTKTEVDSAIQAVIGAAPVALNTLVEIATQLASDESAAAALITTVSGKASLVSPTFTGTVSGINAAMVGLGNVNNTADSDKPVSSAQATAISVETTRSLAAESLLAPIATTYTKTQVDTAIASATPSFSTLTGKPTTIAGYGITDAMTSTAVTSAIGVETSRATGAEASKAPLASPTFTGTVSGITKAMVGLNNVDNTTDLLKPVSTATQTSLDLKANQATTYTKTETDTRIQAVVGAAPLALDTLVEIAAQLATDESAAGALTSAVSLKAPLASPTFTGTVSGITAAMVGAQVAGNYALLSGATFTGDVVAPNFNSNSDRNLKENITKIETASEIISHLEGVSFTWKDSGAKTFGFIAQEVEEIIPELIGKNAELGTLTVNYQGIIPFLVEALKEQAARIAVLESK